MAVIPTNKLKHNLFGLQHSTLGSAIHKLLDTFVYGALLAL
jgi:hypothetical protein